MPRVSKRERAFYTTVLASIVLYVFSVLTHQPFEQTKWIIITVGGIGAAYMTNETIRASKEVHENKADAA